MAIMSDITHKSEKLASAVYFITNFFADQEPLKWKLRTIASEVATLGASFKLDITGGAEVSTVDLKRAVLSLINLLNVSKNSGLISIENHELIDKELNKYLVEITTPGDVSKMLTLPNPAPNPIAETSMSITNNPIRQIDSAPATTPTQSVAERTPLKDFGVVSAKKNTRQSVIIGLLKRKKEVMIKDITPLIRGCSEKTIQRELLSMVKNGVLKKEGEKRWSKYSLA